MSIKTNLKIKSLKLWIKNKKSFDSPIRNIKKKLNTNPTTRRQDLITLDDQKWIIVVKNSWIENWIAFITAWIRAYSSIKATRRAAVIDLSTWQLRIWHEIISEYFLDKSEEWDIKIIKWERIARPAIKWVEEENRTRWFEFRLWGSKINTRNYWRKITSIQNIVKVSLRKIYTNC